MAKRFLVFFAICIGFVHVVNIYLMPNCTYHPASKRKLASSHHHNPVKKHRANDTASEAPYKVKYRSLFSFNTYKKPVVNSGKPIALIKACIRINLIKFLFRSPKSALCLNFRPTLPLPDLIIAHRCLLI